MDSRERYGSPEVMLRAMLDGMRNSLWTALPGSVVSFDADKVTAVVQPAIGGTIVQQDGTRKAVNLPVLTDVPVCFPRGGGCTLTFPVKAGDECLIVFASRAIDAWAQSGGVQPPSDTRRHDLSDAFAIVGPQSQAHKIGSISTSKAQLRSDDGSTFIELDPAGQIVKVTAPGGINLNGVTIDSSGNVSAPAKITAADDIKSTSGDVVATSVHLKTHVHTGVTSGGAVSGPPQP
jgi:hypothetical protein